MRLPVRDFTAAVDELPTSPGNTADPFHRVEAGIRHSTVSCAESLTVLRPAAPLPIPIGTRYGYRGGGGRSLARRVVGAVRPAGLDRLRAAGYQLSFLAIEDGIARYVQILSRADPYL